MNKIDEIIENLKYVYQLAGMPDFEKEWKSIEKAIELNVILLEFAKTHLAICVEQDGKIRYCNYKTYVEVTKKETTYPIISEEQFNIILEKLNEKKN